MEIRTKNRPRKYTFLGEFIDKQMEACGYKSQRDLAKATGIPPATISSYRSGLFFPRKEQVNKLAKGLQVNSEDIESLKEQYEGGEKRDEYVITEAELENLINQRLGNSIDTLVGKVVSQLQLHYEDIGKRLQEIQEENRLLRERYDSLVDAHTKLLVKYLGNS